MATTNLKKIRDNFRTLYDALGEEEKSDVKSKIDNLLEETEWKGESLNGRCGQRSERSKKLYYDVEEVCR